MSIIKNDIDSIIRRNFREALDVVALQAFSAYPKVEVPRVFNTDAFIISTASLCLRREEVLSAKDYIVTAPYKIALAEFRQLKRIGCKFNRRRNGLYTFIYAGREHWFNLTKFNFENDKVVYAEVKPIEIEFKFEPKPVHEFDDSIFMRHRFWYGVK